MQETNKKRELSFVGKVFYNLEMKFCHNLKCFLIRHDNSIDVLFLLIYSLLQFFLIIIISEIIVGVFIILFMFFISLERIFLKFKSNQAQIEKNIAEKNYYRLKNENETLRSKNEELIKQREKIRRILLKIPENLSLKKKG